MARVDNVMIFNGDISEATEIVLKDCSRAEKSNRLISATGAHGIVSAHRDPGFRRVLDSFYLNLADGMPAVWVSRLKGDRQIKRCYGPDFFEAVMVASASSEIRHYLCGGKEGIAEELQRVCAERFGNSNVVGVYCPPFRELSDAEISALANDINKRNVDIVWIGLSTPKQEQLAYRLAQCTEVQFLCTVGAAFDFHTGRLKEAPRWLQPLGLEWLFRLLVEPRRLWKRYLTVVPLLIIYETTDLLRYLFQQHKEEASRPEV